MAAVKVSGYKVLEPIKYNGECLDVGAKIRAADGDEEQPGAVDQASIDDLLAMNAIEPAEWLDETAETAGTEKPVQPKRPQKPSRIKAKAEAEAKAKSAETKE